MRSRALWHTSGTDRPKVDCAGFARGLQLLTGWREIEQNDEQGRPGLRDRAARAGRGGSTRRALAGGPVDPDEDWLGTPDPERLGQEG